MAITQVYFTKNATGQLVLALDDYEGIKPKRTFLFTNATPEVPIPFSYALSIFNNADASPFYKNGLIKATRNWKEFQEVLTEYDLNNEAVVKKILDQQVGDDGVINPLTTEDVKEVLVDGDQKKVAALLEDSHMASEVVTIANAIPNDLNGNVKTLIENTTKLGVGLAD